MFSSEQIEVAVTGTNELLQKQKNGILQMGIRDIIIIEQTQKWEFRIKNDNVLDAAVFGERYEYMCPVCLL